MKPSSRPPLDWQIEARTLYLEHGWRIKELMQKFGKSRRVVQRLLKDLPRAEHQKPHARGPRGPKTNRAEPAWWAEARALKARRIPNEVIAQELGKSLHSVRKAVVNVVPRSELLRPALEAAWAARRALPKAPPRPRNPAPKLSKEERFQRNQMSRVRFLIGHDRLVREPAKVTLPRIAFLDYEPNLGD